MDISAIALQGLEQAQTQVESAATVLASAGTSSPDGTNLDTVDLSAEVIALNSAKTDFSVNLSVLNTASEIDKTITDLKA